jgi:hypothetical protein
VNFVPKIKPTQQFETVIAIARREAGGNIYTGLLLYRAKYYFTPQYKGKMLERDGREWIAKSREDWAREAGALTEAEIKTARKLLGEREFIRIEQKKLSYMHPKALWISLDVKALDAAPMQLDIVHDLAPARQDAFRLAQDPTAGGAHA